MDKLIWSTFFAMTAGLLTAALSFVKLVNDKESRITDYRQAWANSVRESLANIVTNIYAISKALQEQYYIDAHIKELKEDGKKDKEIEFQNTRLKTVQEEIINLRKELKLAVHFTYLHFKNNDEDFEIVEQKIDEALNLVRAVNSTDVNQLNEHREAIDKCCSELVILSREILKKEWGRIKCGEEIYQKTKKWAKYGGVWLLILLLIMGLLHAVNTLLPFDLKVVATTIFAVLTIEAVGYIVIEIFKTYQR